MQCRIKTLVSVSNVSGAIVRLCLSLAQQFCFSSFLQGAAFV